MPRSRLVAQYWLLLVVIAAAPPPARGQVLLDPDFGAGAPVPAGFRFGLSESATAVAVQDDGRIVIAGSYTHPDSRGGLVVARYSQEGALDPSFGNDGIVMTELGWSADASGVAVQADGKIVCAGRASVGGSSVLKLVRYLPNGDLDATFGAGGVVSGSNGTYANALAIQADGRILVAAGSSPPMVNAFVIRYTEAGVVDVSYDDDGYVVVGPTAPSKGAMAIAVMPDGGAAVAGYFQDGPNYDFFVTRLESDGDIDLPFGTEEVDFGGEQDRAFAVAGSGTSVVVAGLATIAGVPQAGFARFNDDGTPDGTFGVGGRVSHQVNGGTGAVRGLSVLADGRIVAVTDGGGDFVATRLNADGSIDDTFGTSGVAVVDLGGADRALAMALQPDGKIVAAGNASAASATDIGVVRLSNGGAVDPTFGGGGIVTTASIRPTSGVRAAVALQPDGKILVAGSDWGGETPDLALSRFNSDGTPDLSFGTGGRTTFDVNFGPDHATAIAIQSDGRIVVAGTAWVFTFSSMFAVRFLADGTVDPSFALGSGATSTFDAACAGARGVVVQADGKVTVAGYRCTGSNSQFAIGRFTSTGSRDVTFGGSGYVAAAFPAGRNVAAAIIPAISGRVVAAGRSGQAGAGDFAIARFLGTGAIDGGFGVGGLRTTDFGGDDEARALTATADERPLAAGHSEVGGLRRIALARYTPTGGIDASFGTDGRVTTVVDGRSGTATGLAVDSEGRAVVVAQLGEEGAGDFALLRYLPTGAIDSTFGVAGVAMFDFGPDDYGLSLAIQPDERIVAALTARDGDAYDTFVARFLDGTTAMEPVQEGTATQLRLSPNPATQAATVTLAVPDATAHAEVAIFDLVGRRVATLHSGPLAPPGRAFAMDLTDLAPGVYVVRAIADGVSISRTVSITR